MSNGRISFGQILLTTIVALVLTVVPLPRVINLGRPDWVLLLLIYWALNAPMLAGLTYAWICGLVIDVMVGTLIGEHALAFVLIAALTHRFQLRMRIFPVVQQAVAILVLLSVYHFLVFWIDGIIGNTATTWWRWLPALVGAVLWPLLVAVMDTANRRMK